MRLPRMTTRLWIVAVVIISLVMGGIVGGIRLKQRHSYFLAQVKHHAERESFCRERERLCHVLAANLAPAIEFRRKKEAGGSAELSRLEYSMAVALKYKENATRAIAYHAAMAKKYRHGVRYPWLPIEPDPPEPE